MGLPLDLLDILESAYDMSAPGKDWTTNLCHAVAAAFRRGGPTPGIIGFSYRIGDDGHVAPDDVVCLDLPDAFARAVHGLTVSFPPEYVRETFAKTPAGNVLSAGDAATRAASKRFLATWRAELGVPWRDLIVINGIDPGGSGVYMGLPWPERWPVAAAEKQRWTRIGAHLAAAHRLRRRLSPEARARVEGADMVLTPEGRVSHANDDAVAAREALAASVRAVERARGAQRRDDPDGALATWKGLVSAQWSLVDHVDVDGKRYVLARENRPRLSGVEVLSERERQAVAFLSLGHTTKVIAYEMGIAGATVNVLLHRACLKLGVKTRAELIARYERSRGS